LVLAFLHLCHIVARAVYNDAVLRRFSFPEHEMIARREQSFARDAAHVQTSAAQFLVFLDKGRLQPKLAGADGSNITARSGANDNNVKFFHMCFLSFCAKRRIPDHAKSKMFESLASCSHFVAALRST